MTVRLTRNMAENNNLKIMSNMKKYLFAIAAVMMALTAGAQVKPGIEVLREGGFAQLKGKRVGLLTNPTGVDNNLKSTVDILHEAEGVELVALYGPEHGVRGDVHAGDKVDNSIDPATGVKVYSLYGKSHKPTAKMLKDIDVLIYDIQDNGCRSYTFIRWACAWRRVPKTARSLWCSTVRIRLAETRWKVAWLRTASTRL